MRICNFSHTGKEIRVAELLPGDCLGELGMIDGLPRFNNAFALEDTRLLVLGRADFDQLYARHPEIARELNRFLARRFRRLYQYAEDATGLSLQERLVARIGYSSRGESAKSETVTAAVSHESLAHMLGARRQSVSRELKALELAGLGQISYGKLTIPGLERLVSRFGDLLDGDILAPDS